MSPSELLGCLYGRLKREWKTAFLSCFLLGLLIHMPVMLSDIPNHDGLDSMYFDQNMITSGRWFLTVACGISSYYTLPWLIGLLGLLYLGCTAAALCELLEIRKSWAAALCGGLLASFPALASTFAYVFTLDGYMLALLLAVSAVLFTKKRRLGFLPGAVCLALSLGIYQAYLSFAMILSLFAILMLFGRAGEDGPGGGRAFREALRYLYMGVLGVALYYGILRVLLLVQGKELADYQAIDTLGAGFALEDGFLGAMKGMYRDFLGFTFKGNVLFQNIFSLAACVALGGVAVLCVVFLAKTRKSWKNPVFFVIIGMAAVALPLATNVILLISPSVTYHLLMRYQWVLYLIGALAFAVNSGCKGRKGALLEWGAFLAAAVLVLCYGITDNVAYSNLQKRYEKTYAYCVRLLDRIEQTNGYYPGIPIAMIGIVGDEQYPPTDITMAVTSNMIGMNGDILLYRGDNYRAFIRNYLGATLNILPAEAMAEMYYDEEYVDMDSFPGEDSIRIIDGIMYIKTENITR